MSSLTKDYGFACMSGHTAQGQATWCWSDESLFLLRVETPRDIYARAPSKARSDTQSNSVHDSHRSVS